MFVVTLLIFYVFLVSIPIFALSYIVLQASHRLWLLLISIRYPHLEFLRTTTIRSLLDTHRNQGIISLLLTVKGPAHPDAVRRHLNELVRRRDKTGQLAFPRLRHCLTTRCGTYAWQRATFDLDANLTLAPNVHRGRAITEHNIQDYVCDIVAKYLPAGLPPWQMVIIPSSEDQHYILLKLHHVLLNEHLNIGDLLPLIPPTRPAGTCSGSESPLVHVLERPTAIPKLRQCLGEELSNRWNEFIARCDPLERLELLKTTPGFIEMHAIALIVLVATLRESQKGFRVIRDDVFAKSKYVWLTWRKESEKRRLTLARYLTSIFITLNPVNLLTFLFATTKKLLLYPIKLQLLLFNEIMALYSCLAYSYCKQPNTLVGKLYNYVPLVYRSIKELCTCLRMVFEGPRTIVEDILMEKEQFQTITLCGRKSVAWSEPVKIEHIRAAAEVNRVTEIEIMLAAISACLCKYFVHTKHLIPDYLPVTVRNINSNYVFATGANLRPADSVSGVLCVNLPVPDPEKEEATVMGNLAEVHGRFAAAIRKQGLSHLLSLWQTKFGLVTKVVPLSVLGVYLRYLSRKYAVSVTELTSRYPNVCQRTVWGQEVSSVMYWRPPQANSSVSLCLNEYGDHVKLGVMCDAQLVPHHPIFVRGFPEFVQEMGKGAGIQIS